MAAAVRNNVWVAPGQDAQLLRKSAAPLTADGLRGEDHGQVLCNTRDAIPGTSSFQDYNLVSDRYFFFFFFSPSASQHHSVYRYLSVWRWKRGCCWSERNSLCYFFFFLFFYFLFLFHWKMRADHRETGLCVLFATAFAATVPNTWQISLRCGWMWCWHWPVFEIARKQGKAVGMWGVAQAPANLGGRDAQQQQQQQQQQQGCRAAEPLDVSNFRHVFPNSLGCWSVFPKGVCCLWGWRRGEGGGGLVGVFNVSVCTQVKCRPQMCSQQGVWCQC